MLARTGTQIDQVIGRSHRLLVVLDHDHRVAQVAQPLQRRDQLGVVALVQADRGLVEDVQHAHERRADLRGQTDALRLPARQRRGGAIHREVADAHVLQELQPLGDLAQDQPRDVTVGLRELHLLQPLQRPPRRQRREVLDPRPPHEHRARLRAQARAVAHRARAQRHVLLDLLARPLRFRLLVAALQVLDDPLKARRIRAPAPVAVAVGDVQLLAVGPIQEQVAVLLGEVFPGGVQIDVVALRDRLGHLLVVVRHAVRPRHDRALAHRQRRVGHEQLRVDLHLRAQPRAALARPVRRVEREDPRLQLHQRRSVLGAGEALGERKHRPRRRHLAGNDLRRGRAHPLRPSRARALLLLRRVLARSPDDLDLHEPFRAPHRRLDRVRQALAQVVAHHQAIDDDRDVVLVALVEHDRLLQHPHPIVDLHPLKPVRAQLLKQFSVLALAPPHERRHHHEPRPLPQLHRLIDDLLRRLPHDRPPADGAVRLADPRPQEAQVVVDLRHGPDRRARVARGRLLIDRDRRREPLDRVHVGLVHLPEELTRVRRQRLHVAALTLGVDRVERQRALARARQARDHHQRVAWQRQRDVLEVVLPCSGDDDLIACWHPSLLY